MVPGPRDRSEKGEVMNAARRWLNGQTMQTRATVVDVMATALAVAAHKDSWPRWTAIPAIIVCLGVGWLAAVADDRLWLGRLACRLGWHRWSGWNRTGIWLASPERAYQVSHHCLRCSVRACDWWLP